VIESSDEPAPRSLTKESLRLEEALGRAVNEGDARRALELLARIEALATAHPWCGVVGNWITALGKLGEIAGRAGVPDLAELARRVQELAEPWFAADPDGFIEVASESRNVALHTLMYAAAPAGELDVALMIRRADDAGNARADARWARDYTPDEAAPAFLTSAWGTQGLVGFAAEAGRFDMLPELLDNLQRFLTAVVAPGSREGERTWDAIGEAEAAALIQVLAAPELPRDLQAYCTARIAALSDLAAPFADWPRTRAKFAEIAGPVHLH
jgi:hypothetical protein